VVHFCSDLRKPPLLFRPIINVLYQTPSKASPNLHCAPGKQEREITMAMVSVPMLQEPEVVHTEETNDANPTKFCKDCAFFKKRARLPDIYGYCTKAPQKVIWLLVRPLIITLLLLEGLTAEGGGLSQPVWMPGKVT